MFRYTSTVATPLGPLRVVSDGDALLAATFDGEPPADAMEDHGGCAVLAQAHHQLAAYFAGEPVAFTVRVRPMGTPFQQRVWAALREIPRGETRSYAALAAALGDPKAVRAVGAANGKNPIAVIVPCHRVIGADGSLTGYAGGMERKRALLALESRQRDLFG